MTNTVMQDDTDAGPMNAGTLEMDEIKAVFPSIGFMDMVGFDGCNMASIEVQMLWHGHATALAHSQEWVGGSGVEYDLVLAQLAAKPNMIADEVAIATSQSATSDKTWSAVAVDERFDALLTAVDNWSIALNSGLAGIAKNMIEPLARPAPSGSSRQIKICMIWHMRSIGWLVTRISKPRVRQ